MPWPLLICAKDLVSVAYFQSVPQLQLPFLDFMTLHWSPTFKMPVITTYSIVATSAINEVNASKTSHGKLFVCLAWKNFSKTLKPGLVTTIGSGSYLSVRHWCKLPLWFSALVSAPPPEPSPSVLPHPRVVPVINELWQGLCELEKTHAHMHTATLPNCCRSAPLPLCEQPDPLEGKSDGDRGLYCLIRLQLAAEEKELFYVFMNTISDAGSFLFNVNMPHYNIKAPGRDGELDRALISCASGYHCHASCMYLNM